ncbi:MAG: sugar phosphate isomerase/epimerase family protein [Gemmataceae bacterium]
MKPCISQACTLPAAVADDLAAFAAAGLPAAELWLTKLEKHLETVSAESTVAFLADQGITLAAAAYQGGLLLSQGEARQAHFEHFRRRLDLCQRFGIPTLLVAADFAQKPDGPSLGRALVSLTEAARWAAGFGVTLGLEFRGTDAFLNNLDSALTLVERCGEPNVGVCLDVFHYYKGPSKPEDLERLTAKNVVHVQVCDVAGVPRELMTDADRVLPGEGDFRLDPIVRRLREIGYAGYVSLELNNPVLWQLPPAQLADAALKSLTRLLRP